MIGRWSVLIAVGWILSLGTVAMAGQPRVQFDVPLMIACSDVTTPSFLRQYPQEKLIEARFTISSLLTSGDERDLQQYLFQVELPQRVAVVMDYLPKTQVESPFATNLAYEKQEESTAKLNVNFLGQYELLFGNVNDSGFTERKYSHIQAEMLPPLESVTASGKIDRSTGVFFKLKAGDRNPLEGERTFAMILRVPGSWQADYVRVRCHAAGRVRGVVPGLEQSVNCGEQEFLVSLFEEGNMRARDAGLKLLQAESRMRKVAMQEKTRNHSGYAAGNMGRLSDLFQPNKPEKDHSRVAMRTVVFGTLAEAAAIDWESMSNSERMVQAADTFLQMRSAYRTLAGQRDPRSSSVIARLPPAEEAGSQSR